jgi:hypothetical protein
MTSVQVFKGGTIPYTITGTLPAGLSISTTGYLTGKTSARGVGSSLVKVTDAKGVVLTKTLIYNIVLDAPLNNTTLPIFTKGVAVAIQLIPSGITGPYIYSGVLTPGLRLSTTGLISGTPTTVGTAPVILITKDVNNDIAIKTLTSVVK